MSNNCVQSLLIQVIYWKWYNHIALHIQRWTRHPVRYNDNDNCNDNDNVNDDNNDDNNDNDDNDYDNTANDNEDHDDNTIAWKYFVKSFFIKQMNAMVKKCKIVRFKSHLHTTFSCHIDNIMSITNIWSIWNICGMKKELSSKKPLLCVFVIHFFWHILYSILTHKSYKMLISTYFCDVSYIYVCIYIYMSLYLTRRLPTLTLAG